jgi:hypothetical protein
MAGEANASVAPSDAALTYYRIDRARVQDDTADYFAPTPSSATWRNAQLPRRIAVCQYGGGHESTHVGVALLPHREGRHGLVSQPGAKPHFRERMGESRRELFGKSRALLLDALHYFVLLNHPKLLRGIQAA